MADQVTPAEIAANVLRGADNPRVVVGPVVWQPSDGSNSRRWYFVIATSGDGCGFRCDRIDIDGAHPEGERARVLLGFAGRPAVLHVMYDELDMAKLCEKLWPGDRITALRRAIEADRRAFKTMVPTPLRKHAGNIGAEVPETRRKCP
jgi:hypothetical protein